MKKAILLAAIAILLAALMILPMVIYVNVNVTGWTSSNTDPSTWYASVTGLLSNDFYTLYPYSTASNLSIGVSQFGEMIDPFATPPTGLRYGSDSSSIDPFASAPYVPEFEWNEGWVINITYSYDSYYRNLWAFALYSDSFNASSIGGNWKRASSADSVTVLGGRKYGGYSADGTTIGYAYTAPLEILYNGPREWIAFSNTTIGENPTTPVVRVYLTFIFDKDNKYVTVIKDIKDVDTRKGTGKLQVEFSNRGEWDLGETTAPPSQAQIFEDLPTSYEAGTNATATFYQPYYPAGTATYDVGQIISTDPAGYVGYEAFWPEPVAKFVETFPDTSRTQRLTTMATWKAVFVATSLQATFTLAAPNPAPIAYARGNGEWYNDPTVFVNGLIRPESSTAGNGWTWNFNSTSGLYYVKFNTALPAGSVVWIVYVHLVDQDSMSVTTGVPWLSAEWDFDMYPSANDSTVQFRAVSVVGLVDYHDASDTNLDQEVKYQLGTVFEPIDLRDAVEMDTSRWVEFFNGTSSYTTTRAQVVVVPNSLWNQYDIVTANGTSTLISSERLIDLTTGALLHRVTDYNITLNENGTATIWGLLYPLHHYKLLYSTTFPKIDVLISDAPTHSAPSGITLFGASYAYGGDPGRDEIMGTADDLDFGPDMMQLACMGISVVGVDFDYGSAVTPASAPMFDYVTAITYGLHVNASNWDTTVPDWATTVADFVKARLSLVGAADVVFVIDLTGSMNDHPGGIAAIEANITGIVSGLTGYDVRFGIGTFKDYPHSYDSYGYSATYGTDGDYPWQMTQDLTYNTTLVKNTINTLPTPSGGADTPEAWGRALYETGQDYSWRTAGAYEEGVVGKNAATVDSAGLAMISAAFKDKRVEYYISAEDIYDPAVANEIPWIMTKTGAATTWNGYYYNNLKGYPANDYRVGLMDDWCTTWPITSANIIGSGGPLANMLAYYANDFETAFYGAPQFTSYATWSGAIVPLSCWSALQGGGYGPYRDTNTTGYAVISVSEDLNGTVMFLVWGLWGRDTYYASKWFEEDGIFEFQEFPAGVTSIVLEIGYKSYPVGYKPYAFRVAEMLGTISETGWPVPYGPYCVKGGIHFDP